MKAMSFIVSLSLSALGLPAQAQFNMSCSAGDAKWEEHWSGHRTCGECLREHGSCVESCSIQFYTCEVRGRDYQGNAVTLKGSGNDRYEAERQALNNCQQNFAQCATVSCNSQSETVSRKECVRPPAPKPNPAPAPAPAPKPAPKPAPAPAPAPAPKPAPKPAPAPAPAPAPKPAPKPTPAPAPAPAPAPKPAPKPTPAPAPAPAPKPAPKPTPAPAPAPAPAPTPDKPERPGRPGNPDRPGKPDRPGNPDKPDRPGKFDPNKPGKRP